MRKQVWKFIFFLRQAQSITICFVRYLLLALPLCLGGCSTHENGPVIEYTGPLQEAEEVEMYYTENQTIKVKLIAKKVLQYQNGDREFPEGIYLEFYDEFGNISSTLRANTAYYFQEQDKWRGQGNVIVKNILKSEQLNTEELFWKPDTKKIFTEKFVTIKLQTEVIYGTGLDAAEDLSTYTIINPEGEFDVDE